MAKKYKDTLNLPRTPFGMRANLAKKEPEYRRQWEETDLYAEIRRERRGAPNYTLHDGPPYPTGDLHIGTGMNKILKDIVVRFKTMRGFDAPFIPGWDCHGLPIEHKVMTELGDEAATISDRDIRSRCRRFAMKYVDVNREQFKSLSCLGRWEDPYLTVNHGYEAAVIEVFRKLVEKGYVYRQLKPIHWCGSCQTALAEAELEYAEREDPSIFVKFDLTDTLPESIFGYSAGEPVSFLIWTTTPWTLPGNLAVALHPRLDYGLVRFRFPDRENRGPVIVAVDAAERVAEEIGADGFEFVGKKAPGSHLEGLRYRHPWFDKECPAVLADYVLLGEGTGCVHTAPGHGQEDYRTGINYGLDIFSPVDDRGRFTPEVAELEGRNVLEANRMVVERLESEEKMVAVRSVSHSYPHCWRCRRPVIFRATQQWFISLKNRELRQKALEEVARTDWIPDTGEGRIAAMLEQRPDWCISRQRKWGVPIPVFYCDNCRSPLLELPVIDRVIDLFREKGADCWFAMSEEEILPEGTVCPACGGGGFSKENDIFDVWFESGSSHRGVVLAEPSLEFPADLYLEGSDQHRGWFQLSLLLSTAAMDRAPFKTVLTHGFVVDQNGEKMSKSKGNYLSVSKTLKQFPADILRLWFSSVDYRRDIGVSIELIRQIAEAYRKIRNTFRYCLGNLFDFDPAADLIDPESMEEVDRWALAQLERLKETVTEAYENYEFHRVYREIHNFCVIQMSSFYMDVSKDRLYTYAPNGRERRSIQTALWEIVVTLARLLAPIIPVTAEEVWKTVSPPDQPESVHLSLWPSPRPGWKNEALTERWERLLEFRKEALKLLEEYRRRGNIGNPLESRITVLVSDRDWQKLLEEYLPILPMILIVSAVKIRTIPDDAAPEEGAETDIEGVRMLLEPAPGSKCGRCWKFSPTVGTFERDPELCDTCRREMEQT